MGTLCRLFSDTKVCRYCIVWSMLADRSFALSFPSTTWLTFCGVGGGSAQIMVADCRKRQLPRELASHLLSPHCPVVSLCGSCFCPWKAIERERLIHGIDGPLIRCAARCLGLHSCRAADKRIFLDRVTASSSFKLRYTTTQMTKHMRS